MEGSDIPEYDNENRLAQYLQARFDAPAYVRRAQQVQEALDRVLARCRAQRAVYAREGQLLLEDLAGLAGSWDDFSAWLPSGAEPDFLPALVSLCAAQVAFRPRAASGWRLRSGLKQLLSWLESFNRRWAAFLDKLDLKPVNERRDGYNRYFVLEKECALRSARVARLGFQRLEPLTVAELHQQFPLLPSVRVVA